MPRTNVEHMVPTHFSGCLWPVTIHLMITNHACWGEFFVRCFTSLLKQQKKILKQSKVDTSRVLWSSSINYFKLLPQESANPEELYGKYYFQLISSICQYNINSPLNDQNCHYLKIIECNMRWNLKCNERFIFCIVWSCFCKPRSLLPCLTNRCHQQHATP